MKRFEKAIQDLGFTLGSYNDILNDASTRTVNKIVKEYLWQEYTDVKITIKGEKYMLEICTVDNEKDLNILTLEEYKRYGE